jgi:2-amino-4-hydroxy-6-hydroxymethyldihydropteridine diphosphokinase|tara:strand:- start:11108 stop:11611 length:504 start_codon:yes stop_codon:yes gene_type:complete
MNDLPHRVEIYFSLGSNIQPEKNLRYALKQLREIFYDLQLSSVYQTEAVGFVGDNFLNMVIKAFSNFNPRKIISELHNIEHSTGREVGTGRFNSRTLDIDLILYDDLINQELNLPRDEILEYAFVLGPLAEINPLGVHPIEEVTYQELWSSFDKTSSHMERHEMLSI